MEVQDCDKNKLNQEDPGITYQTSNNISSSDLDEETNIKLRGDAIGDTLYSQSFVLKTLLTFSHLQWNEEFEEDLCFLWDMTVEKDVCKYLFEMSFPSIACSAIVKYTENRFIEIVIGILANILCSDCEKNISPHEINIVLKELDTDDPLILIQIARFMSAIAHMSEELPFISENVLNKIEFILCNSTNSNLLLKTLEAVAKITSNYKLERRLVSIELITSSITGYGFIISNDDDFELDTRDKQLTCRYMLEVVNNVCSYIDRYDDNELSLEFQKCSNIFMDEVIKILAYFSHEENLLPITDEFIFYICIFRFVLKLLNMNYLSEIFLPLFQILCVIHDIKDEVLELFESALELESFLIFQCSPERVHKDLKRFSKNKIKMILNAINENKHKFDFDLDIQYLLDKFK